MTRARALKEVIRARAAKTGERYTTARRHVLKHLPPHTATVVRPPVLLETEDTVSAPSSKGTARNAASMPTSSKGGVSDAKSREKTGHGLDHWFDVLDRFGGVEKGHTASARHLYEAHKVNGWYSQGITVAYERARGVRAVNQRCDGEYEVSASKVVAGMTGDVIKSLTDSKLRKRWMKGLDAELTKALSAALDTPKSKGVVVRPDGLGRYRYKWGDTTVQLYLQPKPGNKVSVVVTNSKLSDSTMVEERRALWRAALNALDQLLSSSKQRSARSA
jgi:hypothetical protein